MFIRRKNKKKKFVEGKTFNFFFLNIFFYIFIRYLIIIISFFFISLCFE
jgi:hypothetical protein